MKIEKINENKVKITLTLEELELRDISLSDIEKDGYLARELFIDLIEETNLSDEFSMQDSQLFIEAASDNNDLFIITITKIDFIPELKKYAKLDNESKNKTQKHQNETFDSCVFSFSSFDKLLDFCEFAKSTSLFLGKNALYKHKNLYYLIFNSSTLRNKKFKSTYFKLSEFCDEIYTQEMYETYIKEKSKLIIENFAVQKLIKKVLKNNI